MEEYRSLLERTRLPQPSLQRYAVIQLFNKLHSSHSLLPPNFLDDVIHSLFSSSSSSAAVVDQSVRELCRLVNGSKFDLHSALLLLHSSLEASPPRFVPLFVQGIGFLVCFGFPRLSSDAETHPFLKVLVSRPEAENELVQQVLLFVLRCRQHGVEQVCDFIRPVITFSILRVSSPDSSSSYFLRHLVSSLTSLCCSSPDEANPVFDMLIGCLGSFHNGHIQDFRNFVTFAEYLVDAYVVILRHLVKTGQVVHEAQLRGVKLLDILLTVCIDFEKHSIGSKAILEFSRRLLCVQKELGLHYVPALLSPALSLFRILTLLELEDEVLFVLDLLTFFLKWKSEDGKAMNGVACGQIEMLLFILPVINLISLPSKTLKQAASQFFVLLEKHFMYRFTDLSAKSSVSSFTSNSRPEVILFRLLEHLLLQDASSSSYFLNVYSPAVDDNIINCGSKTWMLNVKGYAFWIAKKHKSSISVSPSEEAMYEEMPMLLSALVCALVTHQTLGCFALETLSSLCTMEPKLGVTILLVVLYYSNLLRGNIKYSGDMWLKLLEVVPSLASHSAMLPLIIQTMTPMLHKDSNLVLYASALRLLCKAWEMNERIFGCLHGLLLPECFSKFKSERTVAISMAASLRDICRRNSDRGVELILSVSVCIESHDSVIKAFGFQCLGYLCEADAVDFNTAWDVIVKHVKEYSTDPIVAYSLCLLLRWGAKDAEAYAETSSRILRILWDIGSSHCSTFNPLWKKARIAALRAINCYEVLQIESSINDFKGKVMEMLIHETDGDILQAIGELEVRILIYEHSTRRRLVKEIRSPKSKIEKLLDIFPRVVFSSGKSCIAREFPGAALFCLPFKLKEVNNQGKSNAQDLFGEYHTMMKEIAASLHLSRNTLLALLSLPSWKVFMRKWTKDYISSLDAKASSNVSDNTSKAAHDILKSMIQVAEESIPRVAENIGLAIGAFCMGIPTSIHSIKVTASKFLLNWLFKYEHEHNQWSAAISLGVISSSLHLTDRQQKQQIVEGLLEVACNSRSCFIKGACAVGLGHSCQDLLTRVVPSENDSDRGGFTLLENNLLRNIIRFLSSTIRQLTGINSNILESLSHYAPPGIDRDDTDTTSNLTARSFDDVTEDLWGVAGLVLGLGGTISALFRAGSYDTVQHVKILCTSLITEADCVGSDTSSSSRIRRMLGVGACLVLPNVASFCRKVEMMDDSELTDLLCSYENLISKLLLVNKTSSICNQNLLMASCIGAGSLVSWILDEGLVSLDVERVKNILGLFKRTYSGTYPHLVRFGGWLGVVNAMGADAGSVVHHCLSTAVLQRAYEKKESSRVNIPLLSSSSFEKILLEVTQDIFLAAQNSEDSKLQASASWALSFLRNHIWLNERQCIIESDSNVVAKPEPLQSFSKDSAVAVLSSWLMDLDIYESVTNVNTVATALRCLSQAARLPKLDWAAIIRRCMRYKDHNAALSPTYPSGRRTLRMECLMFTLAHANKFDPLIASLDELTDLSRLKTLDLDILSCLLFHLLDLLRLFSESRAQKLFEDIIQYFSSPVSSFQKYNTRQKTLIQVSCWKGLSKCLNEPSLETISQYLSNMEKCMEVLFGLLPPLPIAANSKHEKMSSLEWTESIACLGKARRAWLLDLLKMPEMGLVERDGEFGAAMKKIIAVAQLVKLGSLPMNELAKRRSYLLNSTSHGIWDALVVVVAVLQAIEDSVKKEWLLSVLEISCMTKYPSTTLLFLGLLSGSWCKYMPFLVLEHRAVLVNLPVTMSSLLSSPNWGVIAETAVSYLWTSTERIYDWVMSNGSDRPPVSHCIDSSETEMSHLLLHSMVETCTKLKEYLPLNKQLRLANMVHPVISVVPSN